MISILLTTRENFVWHSMQEIIPGIEQVWKSLASRDHQVYCINVDEEDWKKYLHLFLQAHNIVLVAFNLKIAAISRLLRVGIGCEGRFIIYLHNLATIGCWPLHEWGPGRFLKKHDVFISSCHRDADCARLCFDDPKVHVIPFVFDSTKTSVGAELRHFCYIGRLSEQKNIHLLVFSFYLFCRKHPDLKNKLLLYGKEDGLGSPNMDFYFDDYESYIKKLVIELGIEDKVIFKGHMDREDIYRDTDIRNHIFISLSLHSDENFGMAALKSLGLGHQAILSDWGGHTDFALHFNDMVNLVAVHESSLGPFINPFQVIQEMEKTLGLFDPDLKSDSLSSVDGKTGDVSYYDLESVKKQIGLLAQQNCSYSAESLDISALSLKILERRKAFLESGQSKKKCRIFENYADPLAAPFFRAYGMKKHDMSCPDSGFKSVVRPPWVRERIVDDPHRGQWSCRREDWVRELWELGFMFFEGQG